MGARRVAGSMARRDGRRRHGRYQSNCNALAQPGYSMRKSSLWPLLQNPLTNASQPYFESELTNRWFDYGGTTVVRADQWIRLASAHPSEAGWLFSRTPLTATNFEITVEFKIHGTSSLFGDGMAMWITKERAEMGSVFGMKDRFEGLGIFFDTYKNNRPGVVFPYIMAMIGDGQTPYDQANDGKANELASCSVRGLRNADVPTKVKVTYFRDKLLRVEIQYKKEDDWVECFEVKDAKLPGIAYLGFSAETGELSDNHDIVKIETKNLYSPSGQLGNSGDKSRRAGRGKRGKPKSVGIGFFGYLWRLILLVAFVGVAYIGFTAYRTRRNDRF